MLCIACLPACLLHNCPSFNILLKYETGENRSSALYKDCVQVCLFDLFLSSENQKYCFLNARGKIFLILLFFKNPHIALDFKNSLSEKKNSWKCSWLQTGCAWSDFTLFSKLEKICLDSFQFLINLQSSQNQTPINKNTLVSNFQYFKLLMYSPKNQQLILSSVKMAILNHHFHKFASSKDVNDLEIFKRWFYWLNCHA